MAKACVWISVALCIVSNVDIPPITKCWTITWAPVNCILWLRHHAFKWRQTFFVSERKYECIGRRTRSTTGLWKGETKNKNNTKRSVFFFHNTSTKIWKWWLNRDSLFNTLFTFVLAPLIQNTPDLLYERRYTQAVWDNIIQVNLLVNDNFGAQFAL